MSDFRNYSATGAGASTAADEGLRAFMLGVYQKMGLGLLVSALLAYVTSSVPVVSDLLFLKTATGALAGFTLLGLIVSFAPLVIILASNFMMRNASAASANILYWVIVALMGASLGTLMLMYTGASVVTTFLITAAAFGGLSLAGYTTKRDLSGLRAFAIMATWGLVFASIAAGLGLAFGLFSPGPIFWIINGAGVLIMSGLIAAETQNLKMIYYQVRGDGESMAVATSFGALNLYIAFINLFRFLLYFLGGRRD
jgi:FtsH-binding integral membrane protein